MHSDLLMLRVACRVVEGAPANANMNANANKDSTSIGTTTAALPRLVLPTIAVSREHARRIPALHRPQPQPQPSADAADLMLGLKRPHADEQDESPRQLKRARQSESVSESPPRVRLPPPPGVFMDSPLAKLLHAPRAPPPPTTATAAATAALPMRSPLGVEGMAGVVAVASPLLDDRSQTRVAPATFMSFIGRPRMTVQTTHDDNGHEEKLSPLESPRVCDAVTATTLRVPTLPPWRSPVLTQTTPPPPPPHSTQHSPAFPSLTTANATYPSAAMPPLALPATTKPTLVRKSSAPWRQAMPAPDRTRTRERILRGLDRQCRGDYDALLHIVTALEEELLHAHTTSKDHYFLQTVALRDRIATLSPPRTARLVPPPPPDGPGPLLHHL